MEMEEYEAKLKEHEEQTKVYMEEFKKYLEAESLAPKTIKRHVSNMEFYLNIYLVYDEIYTAEEGALEASAFYSWFVPSKVLDSSDSFVKSSAASLKKFYKMLYEQGKISDEAFEQLKEDLKEARW